MSELIPDVGSVADRISGIFGKGYLLAGVLPVMLIAAAIMVAGYDSVAPIRAVVEAYHGQTEGRQWIELAGVIALGFVFGFVFWSLNSWLRSLLEGDVMIPGPVRAWMMRGQLDRLEAGRSVLRPVEDELFRLRRAFPADHAVGNPNAWATPLLAARRTGNAIRPQPAGDASEDLTRAIGDAIEALHGLRVVTVASLQAVRDQLVTELAEKPAVRGGVPTQMDQMHVQFLQLGDGLREMQEARYARLLGTINSRYPIDRQLIGPTRMANVAQLCRDRALRCYRLDPDLYWLQLQRQAAGDDKYKQILDDAKVKLDTSVAFTVACAVSAVAGSAMIGARGANLPLFLVFAVGLTVATMAFYATAIMNQRAFNEVLWTALESYRFQVLQSLHIPLPANSQAERVQWEALAQHIQTSPPGSIDYAPPPPPPT